MNLFPKGLENGKTSGVAEKEGAPNIKTDLLQFWRKKTCGREDGEESSACSTARDFIPVFGASLRKNDIKSPCKTLEGNRLMLLRVLVLRVQKKHILTLSVAFEWSDDVDCSGGRKPPNTSQLSLRFESVQFSPRKT